MTPASVTPIPLSVAEVRAEIARVSSKGEGEPSTALLGELFHEVCAGLLDPASPRGWHTLLGENELADEDILIESAYTAFVGPRLSRFQAALQNRPEQVLHFWTATLELCRWIRGVAGAAKDQEWLHYDQTLDRWTGGERLVSVEQEVSCDFIEPGWRQHVRVSGVADAILRKPSGEFCVIEYKLGRGTPEADLAQAALYFELLCGGSDKGALALVSFVPELQERVYRGDSLRDARKALRQLSGRLAGVLPGQTCAEPAAEATPKPEAVPSELHRQLGRDLEGALRDHGAPGRVSDSPVAGPAFLRFTVEPERGVAIGRALRLPLDLQVRLKLARPPFVHVDRGNLVIDVQRPDRQQVTFSQIEAQLPAADPAGGSSLIPIGVDVNGGLHCADLADPIHTHILVAGTTGSGKSEWLRTAVAGLLARNTPETLRLVIIDPKRNAFLDLAESPFLEMPLVFPPEQPAVDALETLVSEMERRYLLMGGGEGLREYARRNSISIPRIVCVCDEYADLILGNRTQRRQIEMLVARLGSKARAAGIHLIMATQQPSRNVIGGTLVANLPCRVTLKTNSPIESRMVIMEGGAENLLGHGDLLFRDVGKPERLQGVLLTDEERHRWFGRLTAIPTTPSGPAAMSAPG